jgi:hypothetical protein
MPLRHSSLFSGILLLLAFMFAIQHCNGQGTDKEFFVGTGVLLGGVTQQVSSNMSAVDGMKLMQEGGSLLLMAGTRSLTIKLEGGLYYPMSSVPRTVDLLLAGTQVDFHPLGARSRHNRFSPYLSGGMSKACQKFYGTYTAEYAGIKNYSITKEPHLGTVWNVSINAGAGVEYRWRIGDSFLHLFTEVRKGFITDTDGTNLFTETRISDNGMIRFGMLFGTQL